MKIEPHEIPIRDVVAGFIDDEDHGVVGYNGKLNIRPAYQREFVYKERQEEAVIESILNDRPLNVMYWSLCPDGTYECMDGQQRTISICHFYNNNVSVKTMFDNPTYCHSLPEDLKEKFLNYKLLVYICEGTESEKLEWFRVINIAGEKLTEQEMRNAIYHGPWLNDAKKYFSKVAGPAQSRAGDYLSGSANRQDYLETALEWICDRDSFPDVESYMSLYQQKPKASELWAYFDEVICWVERVFKNRDKSRLKLMKGLPWGIWYNKYGREFFDSDEVEQKISQLLQDEDVTNYKGIYQYVLDKDERHLNIRTFDKRDKLRKYEEQGGICPMCGKHFEFDEMDGDHIVPWSKGGKTEYANLQMLCTACNRGGNKKT